MYACVLHVCVCSVCWRQLSRWGTKIPATWADKSLAHTVAGHRQAPYDFLMCLQAALSLAGGGEEENLFLLGFQVLKRDSVTTRFTHEKHTNLCIQVLHDMGSS